MRDRKASRKKRSRGPSKADLRKICRVLEKSYGSPRHGNPRNPLDDLIYIILSTRTRNPSFAKTFRALKRNFPSWNAAVPRRAPQIQRTLAPGGLATLKTRQIVSIIRELKRRHGRATLAPLAKMRDDEAEQFLTSLPGVGPKIAKCVLMYAFDRRVLPVDVHVHRVATRLGLITKKRPDTSQDLIEGAIPRELRYSFHVNAVAHGRATCLGRNPACGRCPISRWCRYYKERRAARS